MLQGFGTANPTKKVEIDGRYKINRRFEKFRGNDITFYQPDSKYNKIFNNQRWLFSIFEPLAISQGTLTISKPGEPLYR